MLVFSSRAYLLAWEPGRRPAAMNNGAKVLGHVVSERRPAGSEFEARRVLGSAAFLPSSALSDALPRVPRSRSRDRRGGLANPVHDVVERSSSFQRARHRQWTFRCDADKLDFFTA